jgi:hypothetical protein
VKVNERGCPSAHPRGLEPITPRADTQSPDEEAKGVAKDLGENEKIEVMSHFFD